MTRAQLVVKRAVRWMATRSILAPLGPPLLRLIQYGLAVHHREVVNFDQVSRAVAAERIREIVTSWPDQTMGVDEAWMVRSAVLATAKVPGEIAEVGVFRGGTARVICEAKGAKSLHLFDTFEGLPPPGEVDTAFRRGQYSCSLKEVQSYLSGFPDVYCHKGLFPETGEPVRHLQFAFVHLDVDLYQSTAEALSFFYPRMSPGGIIMSHDYVLFPGVRSAVDLFFGERQDPVIELPGNQCLIVKAG
jgi:hypothetical protein